jgi:hypothetical protein
MEEFNSFWHFYNHHFEACVTIIFHHVCHTLKSLRITATSTCTDMNMHNKASNREVPLAVTVYFNDASSPLTAFNFLQRPTTLAKNQSSQHNEVEGKVTCDKRMPMLSKVASSSYS